MCRHPVREHDAEGRPYCGVCGAMLDAADRRGLAEVNPGP